jgi:hypothetical protein
MRTVNWRVPGLSALAAVLLVALAFCASLGTTQPHQVRANALLAAPDAGRAVATLPASNPGYRNRDAGGRAWRDRTEPKKKPPALAAANPPHWPLFASNGGIRPATERVRGFDLLRRQRARAPPILTLAIV